MQTICEAASMVGVSRQTASTRMKAADHFEALPAPEQKAVEAGKMTLPEAIREHKKKAVVAKLEDVQAKEAKAIQGVYDVIVMVFDPFARGWNEANRDMSRFWREETARPRAF
ncbi:MAG TPA: hypothetical protein VMY42_18405 [Thermoguttaceae bacterium]|nr:hypothetical protein [Thermoguttaceae bacterium]